MNNLWSQNNFRKAISAEQQDNNHEMKFRKSFNARFGDSSNEKTFLKRIPGHDMLQFE